MYHKHGAEMNTKKKLFALVLVHFNILQVLIFFVLVHFIFVLLPIKKFRLSQPITISTIC